MGRTPLTRGVMGWTRVVVWKEGTWLIEPTSLSTRWLLGGTCTRYMHVVGRRLAGWIRGGHVYGASNLWESGVRNM